MGILLFVKNFTLIIEYIQFIEIMNRYTIHCTPEQTKKAIELGAQIVILPNYTEYRVFPLVKCKDGNERPCVIPTAEQMIGWLEGQEDIWKINIDRSPVLQWYYAINSESSMSIRSNNLYPSRPEATLAAIDAALEYLEGQKK